MTVEQRGVPRDIAMKVAMSSLVALAFRSNHPLLLMRTDQVTTATFSVVSASNSSPNTSVSKPLQRPLSILASNPRYFTDGGGKTGFPCRFPYLVEHVGRRPE